MKKRGRTVLILVLLIVAAAALGSILYYFLTVKEKVNEYDQVREQVKTAVEETGEPEEKEESVPVIPVDFEALRKINEDVYAWIEIPGTNVDYPVLQSSEDNGYYLNHTMEGEAGYPGSIYTENYNSKEFTDFNTVIYGHDMKDGSMFKDLHKYEDAAFWEEHSQVIVYTPEKKLTYQVFAAVVYDDRHIMKSYDFMSEGDRTAFLDSLDTLRDMRSHIDDGISVGAQDRILTLSTCIGSESEHRFLVEAVLVDEES